MGALLIGCASATFEDWLEGEPCVSCKREYTKPENDAVKQFQCVWLTSVKTQDVSGYICNDGPNSCFSKLSCSKCGNASAEHTVNRIVFCGSCVPRCEGSDHCKHIPTRP